MGHIGRLKEEYRGLVKRLEGNPVSYPEPKDPRAWEGWREILEILYTPEEALLAAKIPVHPTSLRQLVTRLGISAEELKPKLDSMCDKGILMDLVNARNGDTKYLLSPPVVGFFEFSLMRAHDSIPKKRMAEALDAYVHYDDSFAREVFGGETVIGRTLIHETALGDEPRPDVLDWERATSVVRDARSWAVALCYCRHKAQHLGRACDAPQEICLSLNGGADFVIRRKFGRSIERSEALDILTRARESGLVQIADNVQNRPAYICNCCGCCCEQLQAINHYDLPAVNPSGFLAQSSFDKCSGCSRCARACPIKAIHMTPVKVQAHRKNTLQPVVNGDRCIGCGVCADTCPKDAMKMNRLSQHPRVPANAIERSLKMAIERGHLAKLLFDEGSTRGSRFLSQVVQSIAGLPLSQRILASEQVKSRFIKTIVGGIKDPTA